MNRKASGACIAAMLSVGAVAFAQTTGQSQPPPRSGADSQSQEQQVTLVGCIQRESDYRQAHQQGRGGTMGSGLGAGNEFVLVNASRGSGSAASASGTMSGTTSGTTASGTTSSGTTSGTTASGTTSGTTSSGTAGTTGTAAGTTSAGASMSGGMAYRLTGDRESDLEKYVGQRVEIMGQIEDGAQASASGRGTAGAGTSGTATSGTGTSATGGSGAGASAGASFEDLKEIDITSFRAVGGTCAGR